MELPPATPIGAPARAAANRRLAWWLALAVAGFLGLGFALVPFYSTFCRLTGLNGATGEADAATLQGTKADATRWVNVDFTSTVMPGLPWRFAPEQTSLRVHPGEPASIVYVATNLGERAREGQAVMSVSPEVAARHFEKIQCFCFTREALGPGETRRMPVTFFVKPDLPRDVRTITLSYAFFPVDGRKP
ncbi:MAG: cytochrome c oxidase assembly protein [Betaproteobacteria bacterium]|nr:cytochrome c oxidase assembly protein [Betaproteobacteria bacterium]